MFETAETSGAVIGGATPEIADSHAPTQLSKFKDPKPDADPEGGALGA